MSDGERWEITNDITPALRDEPKPCPFCGGVDLSVDWTKDCSYVTCYGCEAMGPEASIADIYSEHDATNHRPEFERRAIAAWNRREAR